MHSSKLLHLLKTFSAQEMKHFREFTASPYFNKNKNVILLLEVLKKYHPEYESNKLKAEEIYKKMFPDEEFDYFKLKNITSDLLSVAKEFMKIITFQKDEHLNNKYLLEQLREREQDKLYEQFYKSYYEKVISNPVRDENYYSVMSFLKYELKSFYSPRNPNSDFELFQEQLDNELIHSLIRLLDLYSIMLHEIKQNNYQYELRMYDEVMIYIKKNIVNMPSVIKIFYNIILLQKGNEEKVFFDLKEQYRKGAGSLGVYEEYMYFLHMSSYCAEMFNIHCRTDFAKEHFYLVKENFESESLVLGRLMYMDFLNHVKIAVRVNEFEWAENFIEKYKDDLIEEKESSLEFCKGYIDYYKGNRLKALEHFSKSNFPNFIIKIQVRLLMLQIYYEEGYYDQAIAGIDSFRHFLSREKSIKENYKDSFSDFLKITGELIRLKLSPVKKDIKTNLKRLRTEAEKSTQNQFGIKLWLFDKIEGFGK